MKKFNSQICTTREQSKKLLALGLRKESADMCHRTNGMGIYFITALNPLHNPCDIPAWSLHRLIEMMPKCIYHKNLICFLFIDQSVYVQYRIDLYGASQTIKEQFMKGNLWDNIIDCIEWLIKEGYFNKEYLEEKV